MEFTFCAFTYNQRQYIVQQLESIKYQIQRYGSGIDCYFILADDHSSDDTVDVVKKWMDKHSYLFKKIDLFSAKSNQGIVGNYVFALKQIKTEYYHIAAGDDFYYRNNIFEAVKCGRNFLITPTIYLMDDNSVGDGYYKFIKRIIACGDNSERIKRSIRNLYRYQGGLSAPGVFYRHSLVDKKLFDILSNYKWIEDAPTYAYLLNKKETEVEVLPLPLIVYRADIGISHKPRSKEYLEDANRLNNTVHIRRKKIPKLINPYFYTKAFECGIMTIIGLINNDRRKKIRKFDSVIAKEKQIAERYIVQIINKASDFIGGYNNDNAQ